MDAIAQLNASLAGRYDVEREIGRGGMATVYLALDIKHNRRVAVKVLNPELGAVLGVERFLSEIKVTANLQHPNLLPLFDSGEASGLLFYVMPFVEGESLRARLVRDKQLPIDEAVHIATAILSALDYAHRHGVIHRDLKPENILLQEGQPVVADFGIALAVSKAGGARVTQTGISLGTPQYMSPEQATGDRTIDGRTDVYSLGAMLYEMLAGEAPHDGNTAQAIIAKVITDRPRKLRLSRDTVPAHVEAAVECALAKLPADRFSTAHEFAAALAGKGGSLPTARTDPHASGATRSGVRGATATRMIVVGSSLLFGGLFFGAIGFALWMRVGADGVSGPIRYEIPTVGQSLVTLGIGNPLAISRGGRFIAYVALSDGGIRRLFVKAAGELRAREIGGSEAARNPFVSPDGEWVVFYSTGQLKKAALSGGASTSLGDAAGASRGTWSSSGVIIMSQGGRLRRAPATGGAFEPFTTLDSKHGETGQLSPLALADGKSVLYTSLAMGGASAAHIGVASLKDGSSVILPVQGSYGLGVIDGYLIYATAPGAVLAVQFDLASRKVTGTPIPLIDQVATDATGEAYADLSVDGELTYYSGSSRRRLMIVAPMGAPRPVLAEGQNVSWPRLSPNGKRISMTIGESGRSDIWVYDLPSGPLNRVTTGGTLNDRSEWMPDGKAVLFRSNRGALNAIWTQPVDGAGDAKLLFAMNGSKIDEGVMSADGRYLAFQRDTTGIGDVWYKALQGDTMPKVIDASAGAELSPRFSPDGKWIALASSESGASQIFVRPFPSLATRKQISLDGGTTPVWSRDGTRIYYVIGRRLVVASVRTQPDFSVLSRRVVIEREFSFNTIHADYDLMPDDVSILALQLAEAEAQLIAVHNWASEVRARVRGRP